MSTIERRQKSARPSIRLQRAVASLLETVDRLIDATDDVKRARKKLARIVSADSPDGGQDS